MSMNGGVCNNHFEKAAFKRKAPFLGLIDSS